MKFKRAISLILTIMMLLSCSIDVLAITVNMNIDGDNVVQVQAGGDVFFNVEFAPPEYKPNAEQTYTMSLGEEIVFWRHSGDSGKRWNMGPWGYQDDAWVQKLMNGKIDKLLTSEWYLPDGVLTYLEGHPDGWSDIKVTFQCKLTDGTPLNHHDVFKNGVVDCYIQGNKIKAQFYPKFTTQVNTPIKKGTKIELNRGIYPYSFTMFSMWGPGRHYGASRVWDSEFEPEEVAGPRHYGFNRFTYDDILDTNGNIKSNLNIKNFSYNQWNLEGKTETGQKYQPGIDTNLARIGDYTFNGGGATGIGFNFPIYITFEINPVKAEEPGNQLYLSEYSIVNMADDANPDEMTTNASIQAYSNRAQLVNYLGGEDIYKEVVRAIIAEEFSTYDGQEYVVDLFSNNYYSSSMVASLLDKVESGELNEIKAIVKAKIEEAKESENLSQLHEDIHSASEANKIVSAKLFKLADAGIMGTLENTTYTDIVDDINNTFVAEPSGSIVDFVGSAVGSSSVELGKEVFKNMGTYVGQNDTAVEMIAGIIKSDTNSIADEKNGNASVGLVNSCLGSNIGEYAEAIEKSQVSEGTYSYLSRKLNGVPFYDMFLDAVVMQDIKKGNKPAYYYNQLSGIGGAFQRNIADILYNYITCNGEITLVNLDGNILTSQEAATTIGLEPIHSSNSMNAGGEFNRKTKLAIDYYITSLSCYVRDKLGEGVMSTKEYSDIMEFVKTFANRGMCFKKVSALDIPAVVRKFIDAVNGDEKALSYLMDAAAYMGIADYIATPIAKIINSELNLDDLNSDAKIAAKSSAVGKYIIYDETGSVSTSTSLIETGNIDGMMAEVDGSDAKTVIMLPTLVHCMNKDIGQDAFRKYAYARSERLYSLVRDEKIFNSVTLNNSLKERLVTGNESDIKILDLGKYIEEMNPEKFYDTVFYHKDYLGGRLTDTVFTRAFEGNNEVDKMTLEEIGIIGSGINKKEKDLMYLDSRNVKKIKGKFEEKYDSVWDLNAFKFNSSEEIRLFLEDVIWRSGGACMTVKESNADNNKLGNVINYNGGVSYTDIILDKGCDIVLTAFSIDDSGEIKELKETKQGIRFPYTLPQAATRYSLTAPFESDVYEGLENPALTDDKNGAYSMIANIPDGMGDAEFCENAKKLVQESIKEGKATDGAVLEGYGLRIHVGKESVKNTLVYPTQNQLDNNIPIRLAMFYAEIEQPQVVKVYELTDGVNTVHVKTTTSPAVVADDTVTVEDETMDGTEYKVGEAYVSTDLYDVTNTTPWSEIDNNTDVYDSEVIYEAGELSLDPEKQQRVYVRMVGELVSPIPALPGDFKITQQTIGKKFDTSSLGIVAKDQLTSFNSTRHRYYTRRGRVRRCYIDTTSSDTYSLNYAMNTNGDSKIFSNITPLESGDTTGYRTWNRSRTTNTTLNPKYTFVAWRGYDKPVAASYANESWVLNDVYSKFGIGSAKERTASELNSSYSKDSQFKWTIGSGSDTSVRFSCSHGYNHSGTVGQYGSASNNGTISVEVYEGWKGAQAPANSSPASTSMGSASLTSAHKGTTTGDVIAYHPYVMMKYQDINGNTNSVNVLSKYKSSITPINTIEFGVQKGSNSSLGITSNMWSTHKRATNAKGANNVIAGGATYNLGNSGAQLPKIGVTTYQWYVPNDAASAVVSGAGNTQTKAEQSHNEAVSSLKTALTGNKVLQHLKAGSNNFVVAPGMSTPWLGSGLNLTNNTNAESKKYWFGGMVNPKTKIMSDDGTTREYYRISSDTSGNVILTKGSHTDHTFNINHDNDYILNNMNAEWKEINAKTGLVSAYLGSIIRRAGNDSSYGAAGGMWYNEAFPGLCVVKQTTTFTVGMDTGSNASLQNVVDMRLVAGGTNSKADIYKNFNDSWFAVEGKNVNFNFRGKALTLNTGELNLRSKTFYIPNATVYDND